MKECTESDLAKEKSELEKFISILEEKERAFNELAVTFDQFKQRYSSAVGRKQLELNRLHAELNELMARKVPYGHGPKQKISGIESPFVRSADQYAGDHHETQPALHTFSEVKEVKKVYRKIASIIHPDKAAEARSRPLRTKLMAELNEAYACKDTMKMQRILQKWHESPEAVAGDDIAAELIRTQRAVAIIKRRLLEIETSTSKIITSDMYVMMVKVQEAERVGRDILAEMTISIDAKIKDAQNKLVIRMFG